MIRIETENNQLSFQPGDVIPIQVNWDVSTTCDIEVDLCWSTKGRGTTDKFYAENQVIHLQGKPKGSKDLGFQAPIGPYSFSGKLISLVWSIEATRKSDDEYGALEIIIAPQKKELILTETKKLIS